VSIGAIALVDVNLVAVLSCYPALVSKLGRNSFHVLFTSVIIVVVVVDCRR
jgi:preprotein translocase subunit SecY